MMTFRRVLRRPADAISKEREKEKEREKGDREREKEHETEKETKRAPSSSISVFVFALLRCFSKTQFEQVLLFLHFAPSSSLLFLFARSLLLPPFVERPPRRTQREHDLTESLPPQEARANVGRSSPAACEPRRRHRRCCCCCCDDARGRCSRPPGLRRGLRPQLKRPQGGLRSGDAEARLRPGAEVSAAGKRERENATSNLSFDFCARRCRRRRRSTTTEMLILLLLLSPPHAPQLPDAGPPTSSAEAVLPPKEVSDREKRERAREREAQSKEETTKRDFSSKRKIRQLVFFSLRRSLSLRPPPQQLKLFSPPPPRRHNHNHSNTNNFNSP